MGAGKKLLKSLVADTKLGALAKLREKLASHLYDGATNNLAIHLFGLLEDAIAKNAQIAKHTHISTPLTRGSAASLLGLKTQSTTFKDAIPNLERSLAACRPDNSGLMPAEEERLGVACIDVTIEGEPWLLIVRGPTSEARGAPHDNMLRLVAEFRMVARAYELKRHWNLPQTRNFVFTARDAYFDAFDAPNPQASPRVDVLVGLGGVGKSHISVEYAYRRRDEFDVIWWIRGADASTLQADLHALAKGLALADDATPTPESVMRVRTFLEERDRWMLIIDNADGPLAVEGFLPRAGAGRVFITSLNPDWRSVGNVHEVRPFSELEANLFLQRRAGIASDGPDELASELGFLPLALEHAAAYIQAVGIGFVEYLELYRAHRAQLLREHSTHLSPVVTTWRLSIERVQTDNPLSVDLLNLASCMAPAPIPRVLFRRARELELEEQTQNPASLRAGADPRDMKGDSDLEIAGAIGALRRYSLVNAQAAEVTVHRLLRDVVWENLSPDIRFYFTDLALAAVADLFQLDRLHYHDSELADDLLPHIAMVTAPPWLASLPTAIHLLSLVGAFLNTRGNFALALTVLRQAEKRCADLKDDHDGIRLTLLNSLAITCRELGRDSDAEDVVTRGLLLAAAAPLETDDDVEVLVSFLNTAAAVVVDSGDRELALKMLNDASEYMRGRSVRPDLISRTLGNIGANLRFAGEAEQGLEYLKLALKFDRKMLGDAHPLVAEHLNALGAAYRDAGRVVEAVDAFRDSWQLQMAIHGNGHPQTVYQGIALAEVLLELGKYQDALDVCSEELSRARPGTYHPVGLAKWHNNRALALANLHRFPEAIIEIQSAIDVATNAARPEFDSLIQTFKGNQNVIRELQDETTRPKE